MNEIRKVVALGGLCALAAAIAHGDTDPCHPDIKALMTAEQFHNAGLDKLTAEERQALDSWLRAYTCTPRAQVDGQPTAVHAPAATLSTATATGTAQPATAPASRSRPQPIPAAENENFGFPEPLPDTTAEANQLHARIVSKFRGWSGKTLFTLDNGQVWRQRSSGKYTYTGDDTRVVISQNRFGFYDMRLTATDRSVGVSRVK